MKIKGYTNYIVSPQGKVINTRTGRALKPDPNRTGYLRVTLSKEGKTQRFFIHRLVAMHYLPNPELVKEVNHIDGVKTNNCVDNLEWCTSSENKKHAHTTGLMNRGKRFYMTREQAIRVCELLVLKETYQNIADATGVSYNSVCLVKTGKAQRNISINYKF